MCSRIFFNKFTQSLKIKIKYSWEEKKKDVRTTTIKRKTISDFFKFFFLPLLLWNWNLQHMSAVETCRSYSITFTIERARKKSSSRRINKLLKCRWKSSQMVKTLSNIKFPHDLAVTALTFDFKKTILKCGLFWKNFSCFSS